MKRVRKPVLKLFQECLTCELAERGINLYEFVGIVRNNGHDISYTRFHNFLSSTAKIKSATTISIDLILEALDMSIAEVAAKYGEYEIKGGTDNTDDPM